MIGQGGIDLIKKLIVFQSQEIEGLDGKRRIGFGHICGEKETFPLGVDLATAEMLLLDDLTESETPVNRLLEQTPLSGNQYDALVLLIFDIGAGAFENSLMYDYLKRGDYVAAAAEFPRFCKINKRGEIGILKRRIEEMKLFLTE